MALIMAYEPMIQILGAHPSTLSTDVVFRNVLKLAIMLKVKLPSRKKNETKEHYRKRVYYKLYKKTLNRIRRVIFVEGTTDEIPPADRDFMDA